MKQTEDKNVKLKMIQSEKLSALGQMVAGVAHEMNNPVTFIYLNIQTIRSTLEKLETLCNQYAQLADAVKTGDQEGAERVLREITKICERFQVDMRFQKMFKLLNGMSEGTERSMKIIEDLRNFSSPGSVEKEKVDIGRALCTTINIARHNLHPNDLLEVHIEDALEVEGYGHRLNQVFLNLFLNACQATEDCAGARCIQVRAECEGDWIVIRVRDNGQGIAPEIQARIFEPFFTTKRDKKGVGLGLSISFEIVEDHGGTIEVISPCSKLDSGTEFVVRLPSVS